MAILKTAVSLIQENCTQVAFENLVKTYDHFGVLVSRTTRLPNPLNIRDKQTELVYAHPYRAALYGYEDVTAAYRERWDVNMLRGHMEALIAREGLDWFIRFSVMLFRKPVFMQVDKPTLWELVEASGPQNRTIARSPEIDALDYAAVNFWPLLSEVQMVFVVAIWRKIAAISAADEVMTSEFMCSYLIHRIGEGEDSMFQHMDQMWQWGPQDVLTFMNDMLAFAQDKMRLS